jgi:hypothetical protein
VVEFVALNDPSDWHCYPWYPILRLSNLRDIKNINETKNPGKFMFLPPVKTGKTKITDPLDTFLLKRFCQTVDITYICANLTKI